MSGTEAASGAAQVIELDVAKYTTDAPAAPQAFQNSDALVQALDCALGQPMGATMSGAASKTAAQSTQETDAERAREEGGSYERAEPSYSPLQEGPVRGGAGRLPSGISPTGVGYEDVVPPGMRPPGFHPGPGGLEGMIQGPPMRGGGMLVGPDHPMFGPGKLDQGYRGGGGPPGQGSGHPAGARWDPVAPPGMRGFRPDDFQHHDPTKPHPDVMQPGPGKGTDWDSFYG